MPLASARPLVRPVAAGDEVTRTQTSLSCRRCWKGTTNAVGGPSSDSSLLACHKHKHQHQQACRSRTHSPSWTTTRGPISYHGARWGRAAQRTRQQRSTPIQATASAATAAAAAAVVPDARAWILLLTAIVFEVLGTTCMKLSDGFQNPFFTVALVISYVASLLIFTHSLKYWAVSTAYAVWSGVGTALTAMVGVFFFKEVLTAMKAGSLVLIILGVIGLNLG